MASVNHASGSSARMIAAPPEVSATILREAESLMKAFGNTKDSYGPPVRYNKTPTPGPGESDCSDFVGRVLKNSGMRYFPDFGTADLPASQLFEEVLPADARGGDIILQGSHMGVYTGKSDQRGRPTGIQMGESGARLGAWGPGGWFPGGQPRYFRPRKPE